MRQARLEAYISLLLRNRFGKRSERLSPDQYALVLEEIETGLADIAASLEKANPKHLLEAKAKRKRKTLPAHLERIDVVIEPEVPEGCEGLERVLIGEDVLERLDVTPAQFRVIVTHRPKYAYKGWDGVTQALAPLRIIAGGLPTEALLSHIAVSKYADGLPLYRQAGIYKRSGVNLDRALLASWMGKIGYELQPLADHILHLIKQGERVFADETIGRSQETVHPWWPTGSRTVAVAWKSI